MLSGEPGRPTNYCGIQGWVDLELPQAELVDAPPSFDP